MAGIRAVSILLCFIDPQISAIYRCIGDMGTLIIILSQIHQRHNNRSKIKITSYRLNACQIYATFIVVLSNFTPLFVFEESC